MNNFLISLIAILASCLATWALIPLLKKKNFGQQVRVEGIKEHYLKAGTPTMGGIAFTLVFLVMTALLTEFNTSILFVILTCFLYALIGFIDDYEKITKNQSLGLNEKQKLILQFGVALILVVLQYFLLDVNLGELDIPFLNSTLNIGIFALPIIMFIMVATVNATNFTDGLDGLLSSVSIPVFLGIAYMARDINPEITTSALIFAGVLLGFLIFNSNPASVFMGDTGSMAVGGAIVAMLIAINKPIYLVFLGGIYVIEVLSVIVQRFTYKKMNKKRLLLMAPIHHHYELKGYKETKIVASFMVVSSMLTLFTIWIAN